MQAGPCAGGGQAKSAHGGLGPAAAPPAAASLAGRRTPTCDTACAPEYLQVLKQKRLYEQQRDQLYNQQYTIEQTTFAVQSMQDSVHTVQAMAVAGKELKSVMKSKDLKIENIDKLRDEMEDLMVNTVCGGPQECLGVEEAWVGRVRRRPLGVCSRLAYWGAS